MVQRLFSTGEDRAIWASPRSSSALFASSASPLFEFSASKSSLQSKAPSGLSLSSQSAIDSRSELSAYFLIAEYLRSEGMKFETGALHSLCCFFAVLGHSKTGRFVCCELVFRGGGNKINNPDGLDWVVLHVCLVSASSFLLGWLSVFVRTARRGCCYCILVFLAELWGLLIMEKGSSFTRLELSRDSESRFSFLSSD